MTNSWPAPGRAHQAGAARTCQYVLVAEERLEGGNVGGAVRVRDTVRRSAGPWTPAVHALLAHLADKGFTGAPRPLGFDEQGREVLTVWCAISAGVCWPGGLACWGYRSAARSETRPAMAV
jgi:hypothetical protein